MMEQCHGCTYSEEVNKNKRCIRSHRRNAVRELLNTFPFMRKKKYTCPLREERTYEWERAPINCRHSVKPWYTGALRNYKQMVRCSSCRKWFPIAGVVREGKSEMLYGICQSRKEITHCMRTCLDGIHTIGE